MLSYLNGLNTRTVKRRKKSTLGHRYYKWVVVYCFFFTLHKLIELRSNVIKKRHKTKNSKEINFSLSLFFKNDRRVMLDLIPIPLRLGCGLGSILAVGRNIIWCFNCHADFFKLTSRKVKKNHRVISLRSNISIYDIWKPVVLKGIFGCCSKNLTVCASEVSAK